MLEARKSVLEIAHRSTCGTSHNSSPQHATATCFIAPFLTLASYSTVKDWLFRFEARCWAPSLCAELSQLAACTAYSNGTNHASATRKSIRSIYSSVYDSFRLQSCAVTVVNVDGQHVGQQRSSLVI